MQGGLRSRICWTKPHLIKISVEPTAFLVFFVMADQKGRLLIVRMSLGAELSGTVFIFLIIYTRSALEVARKHLGNAKNIVFKRDNMGNLSFKDNRVDSVFDIFAG